MSDDETRRTKCAYILGEKNDPMSKRVYFIFLSFDRNLSGEECDQLAEQYFETHNKMTVAGQPLIVDLRPAFRKPLSEVTPKFSLC